MNKIKEYRERYQLSQEELARHLRIDRSSVAKWESGCNTPRLAHLLELSKIFHCSVDELVKGGDDMSETKSVNCPHCGRKLGAYPISLQTTQRTSGTCPSCSRRYTVEYGKNLIKVIKG